MKYVLTLFTFMLALGLQAQKVVDRAIIKMKTEIVFPENFNPGGGGGGPDGGGGGSFQMPRDMENNTTMWYKGDKTKMENSSDFGTQQVYVDRKEKKTTTLMEMMGRKMGFYSTDADAEEMRKRMDSSRNAKRDSLEKMGLSFARNEPEITYINESKTIAGINCKKAIVKVKGQNNQITESTVWYTTDFVMGEGFSMSGGSAGRMMNMNPPGLDKIKGFPMEYEFSRQNGMKVHMQVTKIQLDAEIADKTFEIPKGYDIKPMSEMQGPGGGGMRFRMGGPGS